MQMLFHKTYWYNRIYLKKKLLYNCADHVNLCRSIKYFYKKYIISLFSEKNQQLYKKGIKVCLSIYIVCLVPF